MQQTLKSARGATRAQVVATELLAQLDIAMDEPASTLDVVSEGKDFRRLRVMLKAGEVVEIMDLAHDDLHRLSARPIAAHFRYQIARGLQSLLSQLRQPVDLLVIARSEATKQSRNLTWLLDCFARNDEH
jgi:hypothetical protein